MSRCARGSWHPNNDPTLALDSGPNLSDFWQRPTMRGENLTGLPVWPVWLLLHQLCLRVW